LFFQGALFLIVVLVLPAGVVGWLRTDGIDWFRRLTGNGRSLSTFPSIELDEAIQKERETIEK